ncbi:MAG TPA: cytochrome C oxidase subunit IV family protein [Bacteroidota bacterium]|nr:cytochrome C oxidase subunit IV family protein [Bacteroidota bacterium]
MEEQPSADVQKRVRNARRVFVVLAFLTLLSAGSSAVGIPVLAALLITLGIAALKGSLVAMHFMHLISESPVIYLILVLALLAVAVLLLLPAADIWLRG